MSTILQNKIYQVFRKPLLAAFKVFLFDTIWMFLSLDVIANDFQIIAMAGAAAGPYNYSYIFKYIIIGTLKWTKACK